MYSVPVCTTDDRDLPPPDLGPGLSWDRLVDVLGRLVSPQAAALLAEPVADAARGQTQWLITTAEDPRPLAALSPPERERIGGILDARRREILARAARLAASGTEADRRLAAALRIITEVPDPERHVWSAAGQPVLTAWGRQPQGAVVREAAIITHDRRATPAVGDAARPATVLAGRTSARTGEGEAPQVAGATARSPIPLWPAAAWGALTLLVAAILATLLPACAVDLPMVAALFNACPTPAASDLSALKARNLELREAIRAAEMKVATAQGECATPPRADAPSFPAASPDVRETDQRRVQAQGTSGVLDITLAWNGQEDLDLHVACPSGEIWANNRTACSGKLEIDRNVQAETRVENPVEHVTWASEPPPGDYRVVVRLYSRFELPARDIPFTVVVRDGTGQRVFNNVVRELKQPVIVTEFTR